MSLTGMGAGAANLKPRARRPEPPTDAAAPAELALYWQCDACGWQTGITVMTLGQTGAVGVKDHQYCEVCQPDTGEVEHRPLLPGTVWIRPVRS